MTLLLLLWACSPSTDPDAPTDSPTDPPTDSAEDSADEEVWDFDGADCPAVEADLGNTSPTGDCVVSKRGGGLTERRVRADCTDPAIAGHLDKQHVVLLPDQVTRDVLWVHFPGTSGQPVNTTNVLETAASEGYRAIGLAYLNEPSSSARCFCLGEGPRPADCEERLRAEVIYGDDVNPWYDMAAHESIEHRLGMLLRSLHEAAPDEGWGSFLLADGVTPDWTRTAVSGFSQGGGMAGMIARDHAVDRAVYFSIGTGSTADVMLGAEVQSCTSHADCAAGAVCCDIGDPVGYCSPEDAEAPICLVPVPSALAHTGADTDGDRLGDAATRATAPERQFAMMHREEEAWAYSPEVFEIWGLGGRGDYVDADTVAAPFPEGTQLFSTARPPRGGCSEHQSMGPNACQPLVDGEPAMRPAWRHAMTAELD